MILILGLCVNIAGAATLTMPLELVKPGMKGKGKSVFQQNNIEEFDVEILGVLENIQPKKNIIIARLSGKGLENTGVIQGMSGSPVYIDGKLIGAVAYSFPFAKEPIAGITPIGEMLALPGQEAAKKTGPTSSIPFRSRLTLEELFEIHKDLFLVNQSFYSQGQTLRPIGVPLIFSGFSPTAFEKARPFFMKVGHYPVLSAGSGQTIERPAIAGASLKEGDPVGVQLVGGDLSLASLGTVTYVEGTKILAFGHPLYNLGPVDYAMTSASVIVVIPSLENSFKLASTGAVIGRFSQDRGAGAMGETGALPQTIPLNIKFLKVPSEVREFKLQIINDKILTPLLVNLSLSSLLLSEERSFGNLTVGLGGDVYLDNGASVHVEDLFSGNLDSAVTNLSGLLAAIVYFLTNNEFEEINVHRIDLNIRASEEAKFAFLERIWLDKYEVSPGERIKVKIYYRTFGGEILQEEVDLEAPPLPSGSEFTLVVADAASMHQIETALYRTQDFVPRSLNQLLRILNNLRKSNRIYFKMMASKPGLFLKGEEMPNLPPSMKSMFASPRAAATAPTELTKSTLREYQLPLPFVFRGLASIPVKVKK